MTSLAGHYCRTISLTTPSQSGRQVYELGCGVGFTECAFIICWPIDHFTAQANSVSMCMCGVVSNFTAVIPSVRCLVCFRHCSRNVLRKVGGSYPRVSLRLTPCSESKENGASSVQLYTIGHEKVILSVSMFLEPSATCKHCVRRNNKPTETTRPHSLGNDQKELHAFAQTSDYQSRRCCWCWYM